MVRIRKRQFEANMSDEPALRAAFTEIAGHLRTVLGDDSACYVTLDASDGDEFHDRRADECWDEVDGAGLTVEGGRLDTWSGRSGDEQLRVTVTFTEHVPHVLQIRMWGMDVDAVSDSEEHIRAILGRHG